MVHENQIGNGKIIFYANASIYSKKAILDCLYWKSSDYQINIDFIDNTHYKIQLVPNATEYATEESLSIQLKKLEQDLLDFQLREMITAETKHIRELLVAKAFSNGEFDEAPPGSITDKIGFNPNKI